MPQIESRFLKTLQATEAFAAEIGALLRPGDCLCLQGSLGAGKTAFARALLRWLMSDPALAVPSPTFALVQEYDHPQLPCLHADLYRLASEEEVEQLDLFTAEDALLLIEWPDRAGRLLPATRLALNFTLVPGEEEARRVEISAFGEGWPVRLARLGARRTLLKKAGWQDAGLVRRYGDASPRIHLLYEKPGGLRALLLDARANPDRELPPAKAALRQAEGLARHDDLGRYLHAREFWQKSEFTVPEVLCTDLENDCLLVSDLGAGRVVDPAQKPIRPRFVVAAQKLAALHQHFQGPPDQPCAPELAVMDKERLVKIVSLYLDFHPESEARQKRFLDWWREALAETENLPFGPVHRDFHSPNLIWRESERSEESLGLVDFQDLSWGPWAYDLASLVWDARTALSEGDQQAVLAAYFGARPDLGAQAQARVAGQVEKLALLWVLRLRGHFKALAESGKPWYLTHLSRNDTYLERLAARPALASFFQNWRQADHD